MRNLGKVSCWATYLSTRQFTFCADTAASLGHEWPELAYSVEKLENVLAAFSCQAESRSPVRLMNRQRCNQKALGGAQYEVACPLRVRNATKPLRACNFSSGLETELFNRIGRSHGPQVLTPKLVQPCERLGTRPQAVVLAHLIASSDDCQLGEHPALRPAATRACPDVQWMHLTKPGHRSPRLGSSSSRTYGIPHCLIDRDGRVIGSRLPLPNGPLMAEARHGGVAARSTCRRPVESLRSRPRPSCGTSIVAGRESRARTTRHWYFRQPLALPPILRLCLRMVCHCILLATSGPPQASGTTSSMT